MTILCKCSCDSATTSLCNATILEVSPPVHGSLKKEGGLPMNRLTTNRTRLHDWVSKRAVFVLENNDASSIGTPPMSSPCGAWANKEENVIVLAHASEPWLLDVLGGECKQGKRDSPIRTCFEPLTEVLANISTEAVEVRLIAVSGGTAHGISHLAVNLQPPSFCLVGMCIFHNAFPNAPVSSIYFKFRFQAIVPLSLTLRTAELHSEPHICAPPHNHSC